MSLTPVFAFLDDLKKNNNREWFEANRNRYLEARSVFEVYVSMLMGEIKKFDKEAVNTDAKNCIFRIHRDIRFSRDKTLYKTNFGAYIAKNGRNSPFAGYYFHIEPGASMLAGGIYLPHPAVLKAIRNEIYYNTEEFIKIINHPDFVKNFKEIDAPMLSFAPKGFPKDFPYIDLLKFKYYTVTKPLSEKETRKAQFIEKTAEVFKAMLPLNRFLNNAVNEIAS